MGKEIWRKGQTCLGNKKETKSLLCLFETSRGCKTSSSLCLNRPYTASIMASQETNQFRCRYSKINRYQDRLWPRWWWIYPAKAKASGTGTGTGPVVQIQSIAFCWKRGVEKKRRRRVASILAGKETEFGRHPNLTRHKNYIWLRERLCVWLVIILFFLALGSLNRVKIVRINFVIL